MNAAVDIDTPSEPVRARVLDEQERDDIQQRTLYLDNYNDLNLQVQQRQRVIGQYDFR